MKLIFIQTYPVYSNVNSLEKWLQIENREKWLPAIAKELGHEVEYWVASQKEFVVEYRDSRAELPPYIIRSFKTDGNLKKKKKFHYSSKLADNVADTFADHYLLKGIDGGVGLHLIRNVLNPMRLPFSFIIGGKYYNRWVPKAHTIFYETEYQKEKLMLPGLHFWRHSCRKNQLVHLPKSIDTRIFKPDWNKTLKWDLITTGRLIPFYKNYEALGRLSSKYHVAIIGDGPQRKVLEKKYPQVDFIGYVPNNDIPDYLNQARCFFFTGKRDYNPRVITEAMSCGLPVIAFKKVISEDVLPRRCGFLIEENNLEIEIEQILSNQQLLLEYGRNATKLVHEQRHKFSTRMPLSQMLGQL